MTRYLDLAGVCSCALLGGAVARTAGLDLFGFLVVGVISGLGGGMIRDVLLQHGTPVALTDYAYLAVAFAGAAVAFLIGIPPWIPPPSGGGGIGLLRSRAGKADSPPGRIGVHRQRPAGDW
ncbi:trimeric intracellular cation channel family protein [Streptomyces mirabilis]|uniref:trimeric intracellular cation channel family protein n=1 Tax=Streptomyces mirabilis TaxID=68239 RepID=UPI0036A4ADC3